MTVWRWYKLGAAAYSFLFALLTLACFQAVASNQIPADFLSYWAAGRLVSLGHAASAYDINIHHAVEEAAVRVGGWLPFAYPPPFLFIVWPFSLTPFAVGFAVWIAATADLYLLTARTIAATRPAVCPSRGACECDDRPEWLSNVGACSLPEPPCWKLGRSSAGASSAPLVIKPQLALLLPFALLAGREWQRDRGSGPFTRSSC